MESATSTAIRNSFPEDELTARRGDATKAPWSSVETLLAVLIDRVGNLAWMYAQAHSKGSVPRPDPIPRPGMNGRPGRKRMSIKEMKMLDPRLRGLSDDEAAEQYEKMTGRSLT